MTKQTVTSKINATLDHTKLKKFSRNVVATFGPTDAQLGNCRLGARQIVVFGDGSIGFWASFSSSYAGGVWSIRDLTFFNSGGQIGEPVPEHKSPPAPDGNEQVEWTFQTMIPGVPLDVVHLVNSCTWTDVC